MILPAAALAVAVVAVLGAASAWGASGGNTLVVGQNSSCKNKAYNSIGAALAASGDGDRIFVCPGTYNETLTINDSVTIQGTNAKLGAKPQRCLKPLAFPGDPSTEAIIKGTVTVSHDHVKLSKLVFDTGGGTGINVDPAVTDFTLAYSGVQNNTNGLLLNGHSDSVTYSCFRNNTGAGIRTAFGLDNTTIDFSYFTNNNEGIALVGPNSGGTAPITDITLDSLYTRADASFLAAYGTTHTKVDLLNGDSAAGNVMSFYNGNTDLEIVGNFSKDGAGDGIFLSSNGGSSNQGKLYGNQFVRMGGAGIQAVNNGIDNSTIDHSFLKGNGGAGISLDSASTGNELNINRLNNTGIDCDDQTGPPPGGPIQNTWGSGNRGFDETYPNICGPNAKVV